MIIRQAAEADLDRILSSVLHDPLGWVDAQKFRHYLTSGSYGADRMWLAEQNGRLEACAVWYGSPSHDHPMLDCLCATPDAGDRSAHAAAVLRAGHAAFRARGAESPPEYHLFLQPHWPDDAATCHEVEWRWTAARMAGLSHEIERFRYEWTADAGMVTSSGRLQFFEEPDDEVFLDAFRRVAEGILDEGIRDEIARLGLDGHARATLSCYRGMRGQRDWWRVARTADGTLAGFTIPSANEDAPVIGYLGVLPAMRGHGYGFDLLCEATRILADSGASRIRADTHVANLPMAAAFERARYRKLGVRLIFTA